MKKTKCVDVDVGKCPLYGAFEIIEVIWFSQMQELMLMKCSF